MAELRVALVGFGAMGRILARLLRANSDAVRIVAVADVTTPSAEQRALLPPETIMVSSPQELAAIDIQLVVECAGHQALKAYASSALTHGRDVLIGSVGALADRELEASLRRDAKRSGRRILIPSGALGGLDVLSAAYLAGLDQVTYVGRKPPSAWKGTPAESRIDPNDPAMGSMPFFEGTAREAALQFPQNANVTAAVSLAGIGFDATRVKLFADPAAEGNEHSVQAHGAFGRFQIRVVAHPTSDNPKTSMLAPCSLARSVLDQSRTLVLA